MLDGVKLILVEIQSLDDQRVAFDEFGRRKAQGDRRRLGMVLDQVCDTVDAAVKGTVIRAVGRARAKINTARTLAIAGDVHGVLHELADAFVLCRRDGHHGHAELALEQVDVDGAAIGRDLVHHVKGDDHRPIELHELEREVEVALDIGGVDDVDHRVGLRLENKLAAHNFLARIRRERVNAGKIGYRRLGMIANLAILAIDRHAGEVAHVLVGAGKAVEERGLAAILVAGKGKGDGRALGHRLFCTARMVSLAQGGVRNATRLRNMARNGIGVVNIHELDVRRGIAAKGELVAAQANLHGVAHGGVLHHGHFGAGRQPHIKNVLMQRHVVRRNRRDDRVLTDLQLVELHARSPQIEQKRGKPLQGVCPARLVFLRKTLTRYVRACKRQTRFICRSLMAAVMAFAMIMTVAAAGTTLVAVAMLMTMSTTAARGALGLRDLARKEGVHDVVAVARRTGIDIDAGLSESINSPAADTAADKHVNATRCEHAGESTVAGTIRAYNLR